MIYHKLYMQYLKGKSVKKIYENKKSENKNSFLSYYVIFF